MLLADASWCCAWRVETLNESVDRKLDAFPADLRARFARICPLIATVGLERVDAPHVRHLTGPLWERLGGHRAGALRRRDGPWVVVARAFVKKTGRTTDREGIGMSTVAELHEPWGREAYELLGPEFEVAHARASPRRSWRRA